jgi:catechol 2,3-dioxygenase-like lactoylglutathione lyase family enzyme
MNRMGVVLFVKDLPKTSAFYHAVLDLRMVSSDDDHVVFDCGNVELTLHSLPAPLARQVQITSPPQRRDHSAHKLSFRVDSIARAREAAAKAGGMLDAGPPAWVIDQQKICMGHDPEGNVFELREH